MPLPDAKERWTNQVNAVTLGATPEQGGTRSHTVTIGGHTTLPFMDFEGHTNPPLIAMEVLDVTPQGWPELLAEHYRDVWEDPAAWAKRCVEEYGADLICLHLVGAGPDYGSHPPAQCRDVALAVAEAVSVPLIIWGCDEEKEDNNMMPVVSNALAGENCLLGMASEDNYKTVTVSCLADNHAVLALSQLDINIAKQVNILISDMGFPADRIVMYPTTAGLGYGFEYAYSIHERTRLAALGGDRMMATPILAVIGIEAWKVHEAIDSEEERPGWGSQAERAVMWEAAMAATYIQSGVDVLVMRHPKATAITRQHIQDLMA
jgi:acetyl-CoA decarbonylase/synthase complex subunit delta